MNEQKTLTTDLETRMLSVVLARLYLDLMPTSDPADMRARTAERLSWTDGLFSIKRPLALEIHQAVQQVIEPDRVLGSEMRSRVLEEVIVYGQSEFGPGYTRELRARIEKLLDAALAEQEVDLSPEQRQDLLTSVVEDLLGFGPLEPLLADNVVSEVLVDGPNNIYVERRGKMEDTPYRFRDDAHLLEKIHRILAPLGRRLDVSNPIADARLSDGSRVNVVLPPISLVGPALTIRKFAKTPLTIEDLIRFGSWNEDIVAFVRACVRARMNIMVAGGTGSGKTTLLNIITGMIPSDERVITVEKVAELQPRNVEHLIRLESRPPNWEGKGEVTLRDLVINALRMRPDRIIFGELQGSEALDALQAMNTGHDGTLLNIHATSPHDALARLEAMVTMAHPSIPLLSVRQQIASSIDLIIYQERLSDGRRKVMSVTEVRGMQGSATVLQDIYQFRQTDIVAGRITGYHTATGTIPKFLDRLQAFGAEMPLSTFTPGRGAAGVQQRRQVATTLFCDLRGFSRYAESHAPEHVAQALKAYLDRAARVIRDNEGVVHQYAGDEVVAHFGTFLRPVQDHAWKAVLAAWQIQQSLREYRETLPPDDQLDCGIGVNTGSVVISDVGGEGRTGYSLIGDAMNVAALLERNAGGGQIVIGEDTYQLVKDKVKVQQLGELQFRGRKGSMRAYEVVGLAEE